MAEETKKLALPYMMTNQAQKETTFNEALDLLDYFTGATILGFTDSVPEIGTNGDAYVLNSTEHLFVRINGAWEEFMPYTGLSVFNAADNLQYYYRGGTWALIEGAKFISLTQAEFDALTTKDSNTWYFIQEA